MTEPARPVLLFLAICLVAACSHPEEDTARELARHYLELRPASAAPADPSMAPAVQRAFIRHLIPTLGDAVGYKAALTGAAAQQRFGVDQPLRGVLLRAMIIPFGSNVPQRFGARPMVEADLLVRVGSETINEAETDLELLASLDAVMPFIELVDLVYAPDVDITAAALTAINAGARYGVMGNALVPRADPAWLARLATFRVQLRGADNRLLGEGSGAELLGHPINVVRWLRDSLRSDGKRLQPGEILSLGSLTPLVEAPGTGDLVAVYTGLDEGGPVQAHVTFR